MKNTEIKNFRFDIVFTVFGLKGMRFEDEKESSTIKLGCFVRNQKTGNFFKNIKNKAWNLIIIFKLTRLAFKQAKNAVKETQKTESVPWIEVNKCI